VKLPIRTALPLVLCVAGVALAMPRTGSHPDRPTAAPVAGSLHPGVQAGRLKLASPVGGYVDLGAALTPWEAAELGTYRPFPGGSRAFTRLVSELKTAPETPAGAQEVPDRIPGPRTRTDR
jgi:hypothetical protein